MKRNDGIKVYQPQKIDSEKDETTGNHEHKISSLTVIINHHKHFHNIYHLKCLGIKVCLCKTILTIQHKSKPRRDKAISLGVRDNQPSVTTAISRSNNRF